MLLALSAGSAAAEPSAGCGHPPPASPPVTLEVGGERRAMIVALPEEYDADRPHRLVLAFHGRTNPAQRVRRYYGLEAAARRPTIFVYPRATVQDDGTFIWRVPEDLAFFDAIVWRLGEGYCIDRDRIFAVGHSLGATFANTLACARGDVLRGIASVAGGIIPTACRGEAAALLLHNEEDRLVPVETGRRALEILREAAGLPDAPDAAFERPFECRRYGPSHAPAPVAWCLHDQSKSRGGRFYPHQWPQGAEQAVLAFFRAVERQPPQPGHAPATPQASQP